MRMAKASEADIEMAIELASALDDIERGYLPSKMSDDEAIEWLDTDDARQYARLVEFLQAVMRSGSISRVVWGMAVICDPRNELIDPDDSAIARHPNTVAAFDAAEKSRGLLLWALYHHQGDSSTVGQPIRAALGIGQFDRLTHDQLAEAKAAATLQNRSCSATCDKCGAEKIVVEQAVTGFPDHHVAGTRQEYCGYCDEPPIVELSVTGHGAVVLTQNTEESCAAGADNPDCQD